MEMAPVASNSNVVPHLGTCPICGKTVPLRLARDLSLFHDPPDFFQVDSHETCEGVGEHPNDMNGIEHSEMD